MVNKIVTELPKLKARLERRYPGVRVECALLKYEDCGGTPDDAFAPKQMIFLSGTGRIPDCVPAEVCTPDRAAHWTDDLGSYWYMSWEYGRWRVSHISYPAGAHRKPRGGSLPKWSAVPLMRFLKAARKAELNSPVH